MDEQKIERILCKGLAQNPNAFRNALLDRCLDVLCSFEAVALDDEELDMLSAAGNPVPSCPDPLDPGRPLT